MRAMRTWLVSRAVGGAVSRTVVCLLLATSLLYVHPAASQQPPQEKRLALVIGNSAYAKGQLATAANDAGLMAQTLQAAGFDVIGARDLDGDTLRKSFRDFIEKASSSGPNTVAMIYLAGYGIQLAGENYFIPVDSAVNRDTDIPTEGLRISDYLRQLTALPLKANIVVLDAAREQPFITSDRPIAGGLALVEPDNNTLIAFNAAPGTVAPSEQGPYGIYAQSLAEMIRTGGLSLSDLFDRVRLRVSEKTNGAQIPWNAQRIQAQFAFFDRAPDAPTQQGTPADIAAIRNRPIRELGAQDAYTAAIERDSMQSYEDFVVAYPGDPLAKRVRAILAARREAITWRRSYRADTPAAYWSYLRRYPRGPHAEDARRRLAILTAPLEPPPSFAMLDYDIPPPPPDEIIYVDRPVLLFSDPEFGFVPPPPPPVFFLPPPPPDFIVLSPPLAPIGLFILPQPLFVPIPVFVRPPVYVAAPPNNIIFNNIHNTTVINTVINQPPAAAAAAGQPTSATGASPALPAAVAQRASLIQQGKLPPPPSAALGPTARPGAPAGAVPANASPNAAVPIQALPKTNALPVPGSRGAPPAPSAASGPANPSGSAAPGAGAGSAHRPSPEANPASNMPVVHAPTAGGAAVPSAKPASEPQSAVTPSAAHQTKSVPPSHTVPTAAARPVTPAAVRPAEPKPAVRSAPAVPSHPAAVPAPPRSPPPRAAAPVVRAAPPPAARPAPPSPRPAPPPAAAARPAPAPVRAAPPPRPAAPAAAKKCPPNVAHC